MATAGPTQGRQLTVAGLLNRNAAEYFRRYPSAAVAQVQSTLAKTSLCRTWALGGHEYHCPRCQTDVAVANSCGDRNCPTCRGAQRSDWLERASRLLVPGIDHYQVVFTIPEDLRPLVLGNRRKLFGLLFQSAGKALARCLKSEHQMQLGAMMVLHTWNQKLEFHPHVHCIVPATALSIDGDQVVHAADKDGVRGRYLVDAADLRSKFRECFVKGLQRLRKRGEIQYGGSVSELVDGGPWGKFIRGLEAIDWVAHITAPPKNASADTVLKYLARYISGGPIADSRLVAADDQTVTFLARTGQVSGGQSKQLPMTLTQLEFVRRWCLHILPSNFTRVRYFGHWSSRNRSEYFERLAMLTAADENAIVDASSEIHLELEVAKSDFDRDDAPAAACCPKCKSALIPHRMVERPSWKTIFASKARLKWYRRL